MKTIIQLFIIFAFTISSAQNYCGTINYTQTKDLGMPITENYVLKFDNKSSFAIEDNVNELEGGNKTEDELNDRGSTNRTNTTIVARTNTTPKFYLNQKESFYFRDNFSNTELLVKENFKPFKWEILGDTKKIGKFTCQKATTTFRGRLYTAWFTKEIPVPFGPWKFNGLNGLILEVYDTDKVFHIVTNAINIKQGEGCKINTEKLNLDTAMNVESYLENKETLINAEFAKLASRLPKGAKIPKWDKDCSDCNDRLEMTFQ